MKAYIDYKAWWIDTQAPHRTISSWSFDHEEMFKEHVNKLGLYGLMELLVEWYEEVPNLETVESIENEVERIKDTVGELDASNDWRR
jgi:hypothetical protein